MNHVGFGGHMFSGALEGHLSDCGNDHGRGPGDGVLSVQPEMGHKRNGGPTLWNGWPTRKTLVHQQMHRDWLYRAWQGGLRVVHADVGNSRWSATQFQEINRLFVGKNPLPSDDASVIPLGMAVLRNFVANNSAWSEIATSSSHASSIISSGKLAIVPGIEVDEPDTILGVKHWNGTLELAQQKIRKALDFLYTNGVRHFFGVHILDTSFGGSAVNNALFDLNNYWVNGAFMNLTNGFANGYRYRQDLDSNLGDWALRITSGIPRRSYPIFQDPWSHMNGVGLTPLGGVLITELMRRGMIIDIDHGGARVKSETLDVVEKFGYPVIASHSRPMFLAFTANETFSKETYPLYGTSNVEKVAGERDLSDEELKRIAALGGMVGAGSNTDGIASSCDGTSQSWMKSLSYLQKRVGHDAVAFGTDFNGLGGVSNPRFGPAACRAAADGDDYRSSLPVKQAAEQGRGVTYSTPLVDAGTWRFLDGTTGKGWPYTSRQVNVWQAAAMFRAQTPLHQAPSTWIANVAQGFNSSTMPSTVEGASAWLAYRYGPEANSTFGGDVGSDIRLVWGRWLQFDDGSRQNNVPLARTFLGANGVADRDINIDGVVTVGMLPDLLQDVANLGGADLVAGILSSAQAYVEMWGKCEKIAKSL